MKKIILFLTLLCALGFVYALYYSIEPLPNYIAEKKEAFINNKEDEQTLPLLFIGDIMLGRYVETLQKKEGLDPFGDTTPFLQSHITIANLEGPIPEKHVPTPVNTFTFSFASSTPKYLLDHGITAVSLSNNHSLDQGALGYEHTKETLDTYGVAHFGGYTSPISDYFETKIGTTTVIIFGVNTISSMWDEKAVFSGVDFLRRSHPGAYVIVYIHWGNEYTLKQSDEQQRLAYKLIDGGVNAIVGSHPHVVQGVEIYKNAPIFYSLGNFIFDQYFSKQTQEGYMLSLAKENNFFIYTLVPIASVRSKTNKANEITSKRILQMIKNSSSFDIQESIGNGQLVLPYH